MLGLNCMRRVMIVLFALVLIVVAWLYLFTGTPRWGDKLNLKDTAVSSIELSWFSTNRTITVADQCAQVIRIMRNARRNPAAATPGFGTLMLHYADGTTNMFFLSPSDRIFGLELVGESGGYAISMREMLDAFANVGLLTKDRK